jgi:hypothetical protein
MATYKANHFQFGRLMKSNGIGLLLRHEAEKLADHLRSTAPHSGGEDDDADHYADHFSVRTGLDIRKRDRAAAFVVNDSRYAIILEVGSKYIRNPPAPMTKALDAFRL